MKSYSTAAAFAGLVSSVAGHGFITSPTARMPGTAMGSACGQQVYNNQESDNYGNVQGELQVAASQSDYNEAECDIWLCKGYKYADNTANVQSYSAGDKISITVDIRAPHTGVANVSIVSTSSNTVIGDALMSWDVYASNSVTIPANNTNFDITIPSDLGSQCSTAGDCVIQWYWNAASIDQTYESCIDFTVGGSGSGSSSGSSSAAASSAVATSTAAAATSAPAASSTASVAQNVQATSTSIAAASSAVATSVAASSAAATPTSTGTSSSSSFLPEEFTLTQFISWLESYTGSSSTKKARSVGRAHARAF